MLMTEPVPEVSSDTRYRNAKRAFAEVWSEPIAAKKNWQRIAFAEAFALALAIGGLVYEGTLPRTINYLAPSTNARLSGGSVTKPVDMDDATWDQTKIQSFTRFLESWRTVTTDRTAQANDWDRTFMFLADGSQANSTIANWFAANNPFKRAEKGELVSIRYKTSDTSEGKRTIRLWWEETTTSLSGQVISVKTWQARLVYDMHLSENEAVRQQNPLGISGTELSFQPVQ